MGGSYAMQGRAIDCTAVVDTGYTDTIYMYDNRYTRMAWYLIFTDVDDTVLVMKEISPDGTNFAIIDTTMFSQSDSGKVGYILIDDFSAAIASRLYLVPEAGIDIDIKAVIGY